MYRQPRGVRPADVCISTAVVVRPPKRQVYRQPRGVRPADVSVPRGGGTQI